MLIGRVPMTALVTHAPMPEVGDAQWIHQYFAHSSFQTQSTNVVCFLI